MSDKEFQKNIDFGGCNDLFSFIVDIVKKTLTKE